MSLEGVVVAWPKRDPQTVKARTHRRETLTNYVNGLNHRGEITSSKWPVTRKDSVSSKS